VALFFLACRGGDAGTVASMVSGQARLEAGQTNLETRVGALETGQRDLRRHVHVLHEGIIDRMKALDPAPLIAASRREIADLREQVTWRLDVIEKSVRDLWNRQAPPP